MSPNDTLAAVPDHVPPHLVVDWDYHDLPGAEVDTHLAWKRLHDGPSVVWTPRHGGHWIATRAEAIKQVQIEHETFSHREFSLPRGMKPVPLVPLDLDPPEHGDYRRILNLAFSPKVIAQMRDEVRTLAVSLVDQLAPRGRCEFVGEFARQFPVTVFLRMIDLPLDDRERFLGWAETVVHVGSADEKAQAFRDAAQYLSRHIAERRANPRDDLISRVVTSQVKGQLIGERELLGMVLLLFFGGLDTVASMMGFIARFLATHPGHRQQLLANPALIPAATDEFIRRFGLSNTVRLIQHDREFHGAPLKQGDLIMVPIALASMDERRWPNAMTIDFRRDTSGHDTFGNGPHRCPGANLARIEIQIFLEEWLKRMPDFEIPPGQHAVTVSGAVNGVERLPLCWAA